jgi:PAS domain S-box-containing protein
VPRKKQLSSEVHVNSQNTLEYSTEFDARIVPDYTVTMDLSRRHIEVSDAFCQALGYERDELIGRTFDEVTAPGTNDIPIVFELFLRNGYMHGVWVLLDRSGSTRIVVRYEAWLNPDRNIECNMELLAAG